MLTHRSIAPLAPVESFQQPRRLRVTHSLQIASNLGPRMLFGLKNVLLKEKEGTREAGVRREVKGGFALLLALGCVSERRLQHSVRKLSLFPPPSTANTEPNRPQ